MQPKVIDFKAYKRAKGIALPRSPYSTLAATEEEIHEAFKRAADILLTQPNIAVVHVGYENIKTGRVKLFKAEHEYSSKSLFKRWAGIHEHYVLALVRKGE